MLRRVGGVSHGAGSSVSASADVDVLEGWKADVKRRRSGSAVLPEVHYHLFFLFLLLRVRLFSLHHSPCPPACMLIHLRR